MSPLSHRERDGADFQLIHSLGKVVPASGGCRLTGVEGQNCLMCFSGGTTKGGQSSLDTVSLSLHPTQSLGCCCCLLSYPGGWQDPKAQQCPSQVGTDAAGTSVDRQMGRQMEEGPPVPGGQRSPWRRGMLRLL